MNNLINNLSYISNNLGNYLSNYINYYNSSNYYCISNYMDDYPISDYINYLDYCPDGLKLAVNDHTIKTFNLKNADIGVYEATSLAHGLKYTQITTLNLGHNHIEGRGIKALAHGLKYTKITTLNLGHNQIGDNGVRVLADVLEDTKITNLAISYYNISDALVTELKKAIENNKVIPNKLCSAFNTALVLQDAYSNVKEVEMELSDIDRTVEQIIYLIKTVTNRPKSLVHIINNKEVSCSKKQIEELIKKNSKHIC